MAKRKVTPQIVRGNASILSFFTPKTFPSSSLPLTDTHPQEGVKTNSSVSASATAKDEEKSDGATNKEEMLAQQTVIPEQITVPQLSAPRTADAPTPAIMPFAKLPQYFCPFKDSKKCQYLCGHFAALCYHVRKNHSKDELPMPIELCPFQDGTSRIPCPNSCGQMFCSYARAIDHSSRPSRCSAAIHPPLPCAWKDVIDCPFSADDPKGQANHYRSHIKDSRGPYLCSKLCGQYHASLYMLAQHEDRCKGTGAKERPTTYRFHLGSNNAISIPSLIIVARSSGEPPNGWTAKTESLEEGLPIWGDAIFRQYCAVNDFSGAAVLHAGYQIASRHIPAPHHSDATKQSTPAQRLYVHRAYALTQAIEKDINAASTTGLKPRILSVGIDGWACCTEMILPWILRAPEFTLIIRENQMAYGLKEENFTRYLGTF